MANEEHPEFDLFCPGPPIPLMRPRLHGKGLYDPQFNEKEALRQYIEPHIKEPFAGPLCLDLTFQMPIPLSWSNKKRVDPPECVKRPDLSNLVKFIEDALNETLWKDDSQICELRARKLYHTDPGVRIRVIPVDAASYTG
jgi:Holliday junction resolvase RusA-like endonuclease